MYTFVGFFESPHPGRCRLYRCKVRENSLLMKNFSLPSCLSTVCFALHVALTWCVSLHACCTFPVSHTMILAFKQMWNSFLSTWICTLNLSFLLFIWSLILKYKKKDKHCIFILEEEEKMQNSIHIIFLNIAPFMPNVFSSLISISKKQFYFSFYTSAYKSIMTVVK